jgi:hypothetical protein
MYVYTEGGATMKPNIRYAHNMLTLSDIRICVARLCFEPESIGTDDPFIACGLLAHSVGYNEDVEYVRPGK